jgi:outer membrane protein
MRRLSTSLALLFYAALAPAVPPAHSSPADSASSKPAPALASAVPTQLADLLQLYEQTLATNPVLKGREFAVDQAEAQLDQAFSKLLPQIMATGTVNWNSYSEPKTDFLGHEIGTITSRYEGHRGIIQARQALFDLPSFLRFEGADATKSQTEQELEAARMALTADLIDRYFTVLEASDEMGYLQGEKALTEGDLNRIRRMYERQLAMVTDLYEVEAYYQTLLTREIEVANARAVALEKLRETTGLLVEGVAPLARDRLPDVPGQAEQWVQDAESHHPALLALQRAIEAAEKNIASARAEHLPKLDLQASQTWSGNIGFDNRPFPRYDVGTVGVQINVPIFSGGAIEAAARDAVARYHMSVERRTEKRREIERETRTAWLNAKAGRARVDSTAKEVEARDKARTAQEKSYELGIATIVALLESKKNLLKSRFEQAQARYDYIRALVSLRLWGGSLSYQDIKDINGWLAKRP